MHPTIAAAIATQRHRELMAAADHSRRVHAARRTPHTRSANPTRTVRVRPGFTFPTWL